MIVMVKKEGQTQNESVITETKELMVEIQESIKDVPVKVPISIYDVVENLPPLMTKCLSVLKEEEETKMALYALTALAGSMMPKIWFNYENKINYAGLMVQISYPPASGKGKLALFLKLLHPINKELQANNADAMNEFKTAEKQYERAMKKGEVCEPPKKPKLKLLLVPGNTTSAMLTEQLADNEGDMMMLLFETETDAFTNMMFSKFGMDNSVNLRKSFQNEMISQMRKSGREHFEIENPKMAVVLCGTDSQVEKLFQSNADGLYSRFLIVRGNTPQIWKDVQPCDTCVPLDNHFEVLAHDYYLMFQFFRDKEVEVKFTNDQWNEMNDFGEKKLQECMEEGGPNATSIAKRHTSMIVRIASVFAMVRYFEQKQQENMVYCNDIDFQNACWMIEQSYDCSLDLFKSLGLRTKTKSDGISKNLDDFYDKLPDQFLTRELASIQEEFNISQKTEERWLNVLVKKGKLSKPKKGFFKKVKMTDLSDDDSN